MGNTETETPSKPDKASSQLQEQGGVHPYPEWAAMQAYYGHGPPGVGIPPPYFSSAIVAGHAPHPYMWGPQPMMTPFGTPFPPMYPHGGYSHAAVPFAPHAQGRGSTTSEAMMVSPQNCEIPAKSSSNVKECGLMKKLKGFDGLAVSSNNGNAEDTTSSAKRSQSGEGGTDGSSNGSDGSNSHEETGSQRKKICSEETSTFDKNGKGEIQSNNEDMDATQISLGVAFPHPNFTGKAVQVTPLNMPSGTELKVSGISKSKAIAPIPLANAVPFPGRDSVPPEHWIQDERELKRERRKQSNRESARRSRLRKQAETEELALKVENLASENAALKSELCRLTEMSENLRRENSALMEKLESPLGADSMGTSCKSEAEEPPTIGLENLLSRVNNSAPSDRNEQQENTTHESSGAKLHQLLEPSGRTDAVAAG